MDAALVGVLLGGIAFVVLILLAGCSAATTTPASKPRGAVTPPMPLTQVVVQASELRAVLASPTVESPELTVRESVATIPAAPAPPSGSVSLAWDRSPDSSVVNYRVEYSESPSGPWFSAVVGNVSTATITGLKEGVRYYYQCIALDASGTESVPSNQVTKIVPVNTFLSMDRWRVSSFGLFGVTNLMQSSSNLSDWRTILEFVGTGSLTGVLHTNSGQSWFRVLAK